MGVEDRPAVLKQFEPEGEPVTGDVAGERGGDKPEVRSVIGAEFGTGTVAGAVGGPWPENVAVSVVAGGEDGAGAGGKLLHSY